MSWVSFWIKPEAAPARVTLGVTSLLTLSTQHAKSQASLPPVSYLKAVDAFMSACTIFVFMALMEYCLVNIVLGDSDAPKPPPDPNKKDKDKIFDLAAKENARLLSGHGHPHGGHGHGHSHGHSHSVPPGLPAGLPPVPPPPLPRPSPAQRARMQALNIDRFSRVFFPLLFFVLNCTYWIMFARYL
ncbi:glycine receptor subunit alpha-1-like [Frankliniella occidentalis]|uniref:Glycine receptor subunit alpha-1-like n=1 Tax=Frankliniella occidentalis TaxID=133901 RepID=A0A9C6TYH4_FRAOC|nr:glycine receptor subunit alpha-1-like [Frankliniella occidentalis]